MAIFNKAICCIKHLNKCKAHHICSFVFVFVFYENGMLACLLTLKAVAFTPWLLSLLKLALNDTRLLGSMGSLISLLSVRRSSSRFGSFEKAPSSISAMRFPLRSILLNVAGNKKQRERAQKNEIFKADYSLTVLITLIYQCLRSPCCVFL